jgi:integron integrase
MYSMITRPLKSATLLRLQEAMQRRHMTKKTQKTYLAHISSLIRWGRWKFGDWRDPKLMSRDDIQQWLSDLATVKRVAASTQNGCLQAAVFLFRELYGAELKDINALRAIKLKRKPVVLSEEECVRLFSALSGPVKLLAMLMYGSGLRIGEAVSLRLKDLDFDRFQIQVRCAKGQKDRFVIMPRAAVAMLKGQVEASKRLWEFDREHGTNRVDLPGRYAVKCPSAAFSLEWYWLFPSYKTSRNPVEGWIGRHHVNDSRVGATMKTAANATGILKKFSPHVLRHSFATHACDRGMNIVLLRDLMGHTDVKTTEIYLHCSVRNATAQVSPLDFVSGINSTLTVPVFVGR